MRHYSANRLERDTRSIIQADEIGRKPEHLQKIAELLDEYIAMSNQKTSIKENHSLNTIQKKHRVAKKQHQQAELSATTLAIIYLKAKELEDGGEHICNNINSFIRKWKPINQ